MENKRPLILVSNDDGIMAKGISELIKFLRPLGEIVVMAPDAPRSGSGCALTVNPIWLSVGLIMVTILLPMYTTPARWGL